MTKKPQSNEFHFNIPIFDCHLVVQSHKDNVPEDAGLSPDTLAGVWQDEEKTWHLWISQQPECISIISHECVHLANHMLADRDVVFTPTHDEILAYLVGYLCKNVFFAYSQLYNTTKKDE